MNGTTLPKYVLAIMAGCVVAGCGTAGDGPTGVGPIESAAKLNALGEQPYFYISDVADGAVYEFDYPSYEWVGSITGISQPRGECTRNGKHSFWVTASGSNQIEEFNVGGTSPIKTLNESAGEPKSCAIDPATGDLAATIANGDVVVYQNANGSGTVLTTPMFEALWGGYDNRGNLFVDGDTKGPKSALVELSRGSKKFQTITTSNTIQSPGGVQWDGKYLTVSDLAAPAIYRYTVKGTTATLEDTVTLGKLAGAKNHGCAEYVIATGFLYCPNPDQNEVKVYNYPAGGRRVAYFWRSFNSPVAAVQVVK